MLEDEEGDWITGARIAEISARVRKTMAETPPDADTVTAATSKAAALMEAVLTGRATGAE